MEQGPIVFISYSHDDESHKQWVLQLATHLRGHGVDVILDQWDLLPGKDLRLFMEQGLGKSRFVLCICSEEYIKKANNGIGGSGYETTIMTQPLIPNSNTDYIIPIVRNNSSNKKTFTSLGSKMYIDFSNDDEYISKYQELLAHIYGEDANLKPPLGENPFSSSLAAKIDIKTKIESAQYHSAQMDGHVVFRFDNNNGDYDIGNGEYSFKTHWSRAGNNSIYCYGLIGFSDGCVDFPKPEDILSFNYSSTQRRLQPGDVFLLRNDASHFVAIKLGQVKSRVHENPYDEMVFDYHIYYGPEEADVSRNENLFVY